MQQQIDLLKASQQDLDALKQKLKRTKRSLQETRAQSDKLIEKAKQRVETYNNAATD